MVVGLILLTFPHSDKELGDVDMLVIPLVNYHGLILKPQTIEEGILGMLLQVSWLEHIVVELL